MAGYFPRKKKKCMLCEGKTLNYKDVPNVLRYINERGKISPRRATGACAKHQRYIANQVKLAREMALIPFVK